MFNQRRRGFSRQLFGLIVSENLQSQSREWAERHDHNSTTGVTLETIALMTSLNRLTNTNYEGRDDRGKSMPDTQICSCLKQSVHPCRDGHGSTKLDDI